MAELITWKAEFAAMAALLNIVGVGMISAFTASASVDMKRPGSRFSYVTSNQITWIASLPSITAIFGNLLSGYLSLKIGRKSVIMYASGPLVIKLAYDSLRTDSTLAVCRSFTFWFQCWNVLRFCSNIYNRDSNNENKRIPRFLLSYHICNRSFDCYATWNNSSMVMASNCGSLFLYISHFLHIFHTRIASMAYRK
ncbi:facilitated trehalose transporter Tret1 [Caerostris darwini]|uniref:Facilitated trehalose transporter Tret1 n=1 Tax=Caerostris darwini TaxID=1538125 RepID=A0AAV4QW02_9ARAC|nr:facilitated trehalose transporter Tret1 [Caerostris darwini]